MTKVLGLVGRFLKRYFCEFDGILFSVGCGMSVLWMYFIYLIAYGYSYEGRLLDWEWGLVYVFVISFLWGMKGMRKRHNGEREVDRFFGELWAVLLIIEMIIIIHDYLAPDPRLWIDRVICPFPSVVVPSVLGIMGLFGISKVYEIVEVIKNIWKKFK